MYSKNGKISNAVIEWGVEKQGVKMESKEWKIITGQLK